jgi:uncharacterized Tic20 family protein
MAAAKKTSTKTASTPAPAPAPAPAAASSASDDKTIALLAHLLGIFTGFIGALVIYLVKKDSSPFVERHAREALNFQITMAIAAFVGVVLTLVLIGIFVLIAVSIANIVFCILATLAASKGEEYRYPFALRLVKGPAGSA